MSCCKYLIDVARVEWVNDVQVVCRHAVVFHWTTHLWVLGEWTILSSPPTCLILKLRSMMVMNMLSCHKLDTNHFCYLINFCRCRLEWIRDGQKNVLFCIVCSFNFCYWFCCHSLEHIDPLLMWKSQFSISFSLSLKAI